MRGPQFPGALDKFLARHREELDLVFGGVGIEKRRFAAIDGVAECFVFRNQVFMPGGGRPHPVAGREVPFIGRTHLLANKRATGRTKDRADAEALDPPRRSG